MCSPGMCGLQGLFRVAPSASKLKKLKASLDCGVVDVQEYSSDPHAIAGAVNNTHGNVLVQSFHDNHLLSTSDLLLVLILHIQVDIEELLCGFQLLRADYLIICIKSEANSLLQECRRINLT